MPVYTRTEIAKITHDAKRARLVVGLCHGCFDILHVGHIRHFKAAKDQCDLLFVSVTGDRFVNKGAGRPVIFENERAEIISSLKSVSGVVINQAYSSEELLRDIQPSLYFKGQEYLTIDDKNFASEKKTAVSFDIEIRHTFEKVCSSSKIISMLQRPSLKKIRSIFPEIYSG